MMASHVTAVHYINLSSKGKVSFPLFFFWKVFLLGPLYLKMHKLFNMAFQRSYFTLEQPYISLKTKDLFIFLLQSSQQLFLLALQEVDSFYENRQCPFILIMLNLLLVLFDLFLVLL